MNRRNLNLARTNVLLVGVILIIQCIAGSRVQAQTTGTIYGKVKDPNGAAISNGTVTVQNPQTSLKRSDKTDDEGNYLFTLLPVGRYSVSVEAQGFKPLRWN